MDQYNQDIFYQLSQDISPHIWEEICRDAFDKKYNWWVNDQPSWTRRKIEMHLDEVLKFLYSHKIHFSIIHRKGYRECDQHLEIGFSTMNRKHENGDIFLWIEIDEKHIPYFIEKYNLITLK